jgi:hypothetical protein
VTQEKKQEFSTVNTKQSEKFKAMAKELEADGDEKSFDEKLKKMVITQKKQY